jgi:ElaB/YqjD/DUF883 family membrane-anchored ribosome-binding protein
MVETSSQENREQVREMDRALRNLIEHVKVLSADTRELLSHTAEQSGEQLARVRNRIRERGAAIEARLAPLQRALAERGRYAATMSAQHVREHPWSTLAAAGALALTVVAVIAWHCEAQSSENVDEGHS